MNLRCSHLTEQCGHNTCTINNMLEVLSKRDLNSSRNDFETFNKEMISLINEDIGMNDLMNFQQSFVPSNMDLNFNDLTYNENVVTLDNNGLSLDVFMHDF